MGAPQASGKGAAKGAGNGIVGGGIHGGGSFGGYLGSGGLMSPRFIPAGVAYCGNKPKDQMGSISSHNLNNNHKTHPFFSTAPTHHSRHLKHSTDLPPQNFGRKQQDNKVI